MITFATGISIRMEVNQKLKPHFLPISPQQMKLITNKAIENTAMIKSVSRLNDTANSSGDIDFSLLLYRLVKGLLADLVVVFRRIF